MWNFFAGRLFDEHGNLASWWNNQSVRAFQEHASCMVNQYANFSVAGMNVSARPQIEQTLLNKTRRLQISETLLCFSPF